MVSDRDHRDSGALQEADERTSELRRIAVQAWREVLGGDGYVDSDDFFDCGGDSVLALQVLAQISNELDRPVPMTAILETPTMGELVRSLANLDRRDGL